MTPVTAAALPKLAELSPGADPRAPPDREITPRPLRPPTTSPRTFSRIGQLTAPRSHQYRLCFARCPPPAESKSSVRDVAQSALLVVSNSWLLGLITSFQQGLPVALYEFWIGCDTPRPRNRLTIEHADQLLQLLIESGTHYLLSLFPASYVTTRRAQGVLASTHAMHTVALLKWFNAAFPDLRVPTMMTRFAAKRGDLAVLQYLREHMSVIDGCHPDAFHDAYLGGHLDVLEYLLAHHGRPRWELQQRIILVSDPLIHELVDRHLPAFEAAFLNAIHSALFAGDVGTVQALHSRGTPHKLISIDRAAEWEGLAGLQFLHERGLAVATTGAMDDAASRGRWDVAEFLHTHRTEGCTTRAMDRAAYWKNLEWVRFFHENRSEGCSTDAMDNAASNGAMGILRYLHAHSRVGCTTRAMDAAARRGHLHIVKFLHENRSEGCTTSAMDDAARNGYLEVVQYLCDHRSEGCTVTGVKNALRDNQLAVVQLLYDQYPHLFGRELLFDLLLHGAFEIFMKLRDDFPDEAERVMEPALVDAAKKLELATIHFIVNDLGRTDLKQQAADAAASYDVRWGGILWQRTVEAVIHPGAQSTTAPLHPFLIAPRTQRWAIREVVFNSLHDANRNRHHPSYAWAVRAVRHSDVSLLNVMRDLSANDSTGEFSFAGARAEAIRTGSQSILEWLFTNIDLAVEPTLLADAVYYHQFDIAEWLVAHYPAACTDFDWTIKVREYGTNDYGLRDDLLDSLERHDTVRNAVSIEGIIDYAARTNDVASLKRLYDWYPELFQARPSFVGLAIEDCANTINFLMEIGVPSAALDSK